MQELTPDDQAAGDRTLRLPDGTELTGTTPVVLIGPNGSGKTRRVRDIQAACSIEFVNALRNTRIQASVPAMSYADAENNFVGQRNQSRNNHWEWTNEFDFLLASLLAQHATTAIQFRDAVKAGKSAPDASDTFQRIRDLWQAVFPGRELAIDDYRPIIKSSVSGEAIEYAAGARPQRRRLGGAAVARPAGSRWPDPSSRRFPTRCGCNIGSPTPTQ